MNTHADKTAETKSNAVANDLTVQQSGEQETFQPEDNRPETIAQRQLQEAANNSPQVKQLKILQAMANTSPQVKQLKAAQLMADDGTSNTKQVKQINKGKTVQKKSYPQQTKNKTGVTNHSASGQKTNLARGEWHVAQPVTINTEAAANVGKPVQKMSNTGRQDVFFRPEKQKAGAQGLAHLSSADIVQRATLEVTTVDFNPDTKQKHDFNIDGANTTAILDDSYDEIADGLKGYKTVVNEAFQDLVGSDKNIAAKDVPTLAGKIYDELLKRYTNVNKTLGPLTGAHKSSIENVVKSKLNTYMKGRIFGSGLTSKDDKKDFNRLITISTTKSQDKGTAGEMTEDALNGFDAAAKTEASNVDAAFKAMGVNAAAIAGPARELNYKADLATLPVIRQAHHNVAGWLPALPRPAGKPWKAGDHDRSSVVAWMSSVGAPSLYLEFNGGQKASRIVYDPENNISYATMHYASLSGYNPFFKIT